MKSGKILLIWLDLNREIMYNNCSVKYSLCIKHSFCCLLSFVLHIFILFYFSGKAELMALLFFLNKSACVAENNCGGGKMNVTPEMYSEMTKKASPKSNSKVNIPVAFIVGGAICTLGQLLMIFFEKLGAEQNSASAWTSIILVGLSSLFTGLGLYEKLAKHAGAGTLVPITGFSNAISSSAIEAQSEGLITGVGAKIFTIAGPVILYGCSASVIYGMIYWATHVLQ